MEFLTEIQKEDWNDEYSKKLRRVRRLLEKGIVDPREAVLYGTSKKVQDFPNGPGVIKDGPLCNFPRPPYLGNGVLAHESVPAAVFAFLKNWGDLPGAVQFAIQMGGDMDTIGAMTGALAGALCGIDSIPSESLNDMENGKRGKVFAMRVAGDLHRKFHCHQSASSI